MGEVILASHEFKGIKQPRRLLLMRRVDIAVERVRAENRDKFPFWTDGVIMSRCYDLDPSLRCHACIDMDTMFLASARFWRARA